ncbi:MAG: hypothetical protein EKK41_16035 [Hyphomicrobiales bacterium]|nr:MAG: hypothetical protein EKK41_16035 [Hyphomicrobiales bacterium]
MRQRARHSHDSTDPTAHSDGPFVSFTDLLSGIVLIFLLMIALLLMRQEGAVSELKSSVEQKQVETKPTVADLEKEIAELRRKNEMLSRQDADNLGRLATAQNALEAIQSDLRNRPRFRPAMAINYYDRELHSNQRTQLYARTEYIYISEDNTQWMPVVSKDKGRYDYVEATPGTPDAFKNAPTYSYTNHSCETFTRQAYVKDCGDGYRANLRRDGNRYVGIISNTGKTFNYSWEVTWEIIAFYDDYFR